MSATATEPAASDTSAPLTLDRLRALGAALPGGHRVESAGVADVLSAVAAIVTHGEPVLLAAEEGGKALLEFLHEASTKVAEAEGMPAPAKGAALLSPGVPVTPKSHTDNKIDELHSIVAMLAKQVESLVTGNATADDSASS